MFGAQTQFYDLVYFTFLKQFLICRMEFIGERWSFDEEREELILEGNTVRVCPKNSSPQEVEAGALL